VRSRLAASSVGEQDALASMSGSPSRSATQPGAAVPVRQRVAFCVWCLIMGELLRLVSKCFSLGISTYHKLVLEVCAAIKSVLMPRFLQWLATEPGHRQGGGGANG
jgi:hypothetical protein